MFYADVVKLVYTPDLGSGVARRESSSLSIRTIQAWPSPSYFLQLSYFYIILIFYLIAS